MMPFTLNMLRLMRDYNGRHSERTDPTDVPFDRLRGRRQVKGCHMRQIEYFSQSALVWNVFNSSLKKLHNIMDLKKLYTKISIYFVNSQKMPIMFAINHVWRYLNLSCTLIHSAPHPALSALPQKNANDYKLHFYATESSSQRCSFISAKI